MMSFIADQVPGCCGAVNLFLNEFADNWDPNRSDLADFKESMIKKLQDLKYKDYAVCIIVLNTNQNRSLRSIVTKIGFRKSWGPIRNYGGDASIYGYHINLHSFNRKRNLIKSKF